MRHMVRLVMANAWCVSRAAMQRTGADDVAEANPIASAQAWLRNAEQGVKASTAARAPVSRTPSDTKLSALPGGVTPS